MRKNARRLLDSWFALGTTMPRQSRTRAQPCTENEVGTLVLLSKRRNTSHWLVITKLLGAADVVRCRIQFADESFESYSACPFTSNSPKSTKSDLRTFLSHHFLRHLSDHSIISVISSAIHFENVPNSPDFGSSPRGPCYHHNSHRLTHSGKRPRRLYYTSRDHPRTRATKLGLAQSRICRALR